MVIAEHHDASRTRRVTVTRNRAGWAVREEHDRAVVREVTYTDWHRVERAVQVFELQWPPKRSTPK